MELAHDIEETAREISARVGPQIEDAKKRLSEVNDQVTGYIKENPARCVLGAIALGYVVGKIARR